MKFPFIHDFVYFLTIVIPWFALLLHYTSSGSNVIIIFDDDLNTHCENSLNNLETCSPNVWQAFSNKKCIGEFENILVLGKETLEECLDECFYRPNCSAVNIGSSRECHIFYNANLNKGCKNEIMWMTYELKCCILKPIKENENENLLIVHRPENVCSMESLANKDETKCQNKVWKISDSIAYSGFVNPTIVENISTKACLNRCLKNLNCQYVAFQISKNYNCHHYFTNPSSLKTVVAPDWVFYQRICCKLKVYSTKNMWLMDERKKTGNDLFTHLNEWRWSIVMIAVFLFFLISMIFVWNSIRKRSREQEELTKVNDEYFRTTNECAEEMNK